MSKIIIYTFGSLGDLHPYLALGLGLKEVGNEVVIATSDIYKERVEAAGLAYHHIRPLFREFIDNEELARKAMDLKKGGEYIIRELIYRHIEESYADLEAICSTADLLITHSIGYAGPIVAEKLKIPWISCALSPNVYLSLYDPPIFPISPVFRHLPAMGKWPNKLLFSITRRVVRSWNKPVLAFRQRLGLPAGGDPVFEQLHSPFLSLSLFSSVFSQKQPDWPSNNVVTGFCFYDDLTVDGGLDAFVARDKEPPVLFTLGSAAVQTAADFYEVCLEVIGQLGIRAVILKGNNDLSIPSGLAADVYVSQYISFNQAFGKCRVIVNQGGVGTVAQVMRAGKPMLGVPYSHDQPDNVFRIKRLGMGEVIYRADLKPGNLGKMLRRLIQDQSYYRCAEEVAKKIKPENGVGRACEEIAAFTRRV